MNHVVGAVQQVVSIKIPWPLPLEMSSLLLPPTSKEYSIIYPNVLASLHTQKPPSRLRMADPDGSSGGGGYFTYQCCYWNEQNCGGWVYQNGDACAECQVLRHAVPTPIKTMEC